MTEGQIETNNETWHEPFSNRFAGFLEHLEWGHCLTCVLCLFDKSPTCFFSHFRCPSRVSSSKTNALPEIMCPGWIISVSSSVANMDRSEQTSPRSDLVQMDSIKWMSLLQGGAQTPIDAIMIFKEGVPHLTVFSSLRQRFASWSWSLERAECHPLHSCCKLRLDRNGRIHSMQVVAISRSKTFLFFSCNVVEDVAADQAWAIQVQLKPSIGGPQIDEYWNNIVLGMAWALSTWSTFFIHFLILTPLSACNLI